MRFGVLVVPWMSAAWACGGQSVGDMTSRGDGVTGGTSSSGSSGSGGSNAGTTARGGSPGGGFGGIGTGGGPIECAQPFDSFDVGCDARTALQQQCARGGCHNAVFGAARLNLTPDDLLVARILDVPATFESITPPGTTLTCRPATCPPLGATLLVDSRAPEESWMLRKMVPYDFGTHEIVDLGCGTNMPYPPGNTGYTEERMACLERLFLAIAENGRPCPTSREAPAPVAPCP